MTFNKVMIFMVITQQL